VIQRRTLLLFQAVTVRLGVYQQMEALLLALRSCQTAKQQQQQGLEVLRVGQAGRTLQLA
jgi:hypothetical protein